VSDALGASHSARAHIHAHTQRERERERERDGGHTDIWETHGDGALAGALGEGLCYIVGTLGKLLHLEHAHGAWSVCKRVKRDLM
jgi:hypothetical protein